MAAFGYLHYERERLIAEELGPACVSTSQPCYVATIAPLAAILNELTVGRAEVVTMLPAGASPHTYEPRPSDLRGVMHASGFFYVDERLDGWAADLPAKQKVHVLELVPDDCLLHLETDCCPKEHESRGHKHHDPVVDPHFWLDPCVVRNTVPELVKVLAELDPHGAEIYAANAEEFSRHLTEMDREVHDLIDPIRGSRVATTHPSFQYLCKQYGLEVALVVTDSPGKEPSPRQMENLSREAKELGVKAIYSEPQIPQNAARMLSEASGLPLYELDPVGGCAERCSYDELILYNAQVLAASLK
ncbi:MAG: metal ABC transporter substrate-binding protein [bacterium]